MAKRTRGTRTPPKRPANRPNTIRPARPVSAPLAPAQPMPSQVEAAALVIESPEDRPAATAARPPAGIARSTPGRAKIKPNSLLASRASSEYLYLGKDLRHIALYGTGLFVALLLIWVLVVPLNLLGLY